MYTIIFFINHFIHIANIIDHLSLLFTDILFFMVIIIKRLSDFFFIGEKTKNIVYKSCKYLK